MEIHNAPILYLVAFQNLMWVGGGYFLVQGERQNTLQLECADKTRKLQE